MSEDTREAIIQRFDAALVQMHGCSRYTPEDVDELESAAWDVLPLLKTQEPVAPYVDYDGQDVWRCGSCGATLFHLSHTQADENEQNCVKFCRYCGKAVEWDENQN